MRHLLSRSRGFIALILVLGVLLPLPLTAGEYTIRLATLIFMWAALTGSWNLLAGYAGVVDLGPGFHYGVGAFATAILMTKAHLPFLVSLGLAGVVSMSIAFLIGLPTLKLRGAYFSIGTLALAESGKQLVLAWDRLTGIPLTGGSAGISLPLLDGSLFFYYLMLVLMALPVVTAFWLESSKFGYGLRAIGENELLADASGVNLYQLKHRLYIISALFIAATGGAVAAWISYINATEIFSIAMTFQMVVMALLGGLGTAFGPLLGATFLTLSSELLGTRFANHYLIAIGIIIIAIPLFIPSGLIGIAKLIRRRQSEQAS